MGKDHILERIHDFVEPYKITSGKNFKLSDIDPGDTGPLTSEKKTQAKELLQKGIEYLAEMQDMLYAQDNWAMLLIFQAMDAAGKDGTIKHVMSGVNPQGCQVYSFKPPSEEELDHDWMWRYQRCVPERGRIGIFNRSYYEEVLVVRVHKQVLAKQKMPPSLVTKNIWEERLSDMACFEQYLARNGVVVLKFFLHVSKKEQKKRFLERLSLPEKHWKFSPADVLDRKFWDDYMEAYQEAIASTASKQAPWFVVPADNKWFTRLVVAGAIVETMAKLDLAYPTVDKKRMQELAAAGAQLMRSKD